MRFIYKVKSLLAIIIVVTLNCQVFNTVSAKEPELKYVALGDSIAYGMGADKGNGYVELFYKYLKSQNKFSSLDLINLSVPGQTSSNLLQKLKSDNKLKTQLTNANIVTICIGGNNLLLPVFRIMSETFGVNPNNDNFVEELSKKIEASPNRREMLNSVLKSDKLMAQIAKGTEDFKNDWTEIVNIIKGYAPKAQIYVMTIYNPFDKKEILYSVLDDFIVNMNQSILALGNSYIVADAYGRFKEQNYKRLTNLNISAGVLDPHPNNEGHNTIFLCHVNAVTALSLNKEREELYVGEVFKLQSIVSPEEAYDKRIVWSSDNPKIAVVDKLGNITGKAEGETRITAALYGGKTATCIISVKKRTILSLAGRADLIISALVTAVLFVGLGIIIAGRRRKSRK